MASSTAVTTSSGAAVADGLLQAGHQDIVTAEYTDADDGEGGTNVIKLSTAETDCAGPLVFDAATSGIDDTSATVTWSTDEPATAIVRFGEFPPPD